MTNTISIPGSASFYLNDLLDIARQAGAAIMDIYQNEEIVVTLKNDQSPLTLADQASNDLIVKGLQKLTPGLPVISEEEKDIPYDMRKGYTCFWCVDPLDGTKEFIKRNGEFTVNIALIHQNKPLLGVIYVPVTGQMYFGGPDMGSWKINDGGEKTQLNVNRNTEDWTAVGSRSHASVEETALLAQYPIKNTVTVGSSLKFCMIAEGLAQIYYRHGPTMEWDTASGQAIAEGAGAVMTDPAGDVFYYNKPSLLNGPFLVRVK